MREDLQFEFKVKYIGVDERISDSLVTETENQKEAICDLLRAFDGDNALISCDNFQMFSTMVTMEKCYFLRVNDYSENCKNKVNTFADWCLKEAIQKECKPSWVFLFFSGSNKLTMTFINEILDTVLSIDGLNHEDLKLSQCIRIDETIVQSNFMEVSVIFCFGYL
ncbi:MAG: hypothetical protein JNL36_06065 [Candidatus Kapabacteria bacterium]|nr:hypothetical protein [Candidatus Kapabacteria bacterium]